jgi:hypothetical protein
MTPSKPYTENLFERLHNPNEAGGYLAACLEDGDKRVIALCLQDIARAWEVPTDVREAFERGAATERAECDELLAALGPFYDYAAKHLSWPGSAYNPTLRRARKAIETLRARDVATEGDK